MSETKTMPNLIEANCESCVHCRKVYYKPHKREFSANPTTWKSPESWLMCKYPFDKDCYVLGICTRRTPNLLVTLVSSCKEWKHDNTNQKT